MKRIELIEQKETEVSQYGDEITEFVYQRYVIFGPPDGLSYEQVRKVEVTRLRNDEGRYEFQIDYLRAVAHMTTHLGEESRADAILPISEIEAYCEGVDAAYESMFDKLDSYLAHEKTDEIRNDFWNQLEQNKLITRG